MARWIGITSNIDLYEKSFPFLAMMKLIFFYYITHKFGYSVTNDAEKYEDSKQVLTLILFHDIGRIKACPDLTICYRTLSLDSEH